MYPGVGSDGISEMTYTILPAISLDETTPRQHLILSYSPGFTFYQPSSSLNEIDQGADLQYQFFLTPHASLSVGDSFRKSSTSFGDGTISGSLPNTVPGIIAPFAETLTNSADVRFSLQLSPTAMIGASGSHGLSQYPNSGQATGLYNSEQRGGSAFYNRRISTTQYTGLTYQYSWVHASPVKPQSEEPLESETQTQAFFAFYTLYLRHSFTASASGGVQHYAVTETSSPEAGGWAPMVMGSIGWQVSRTSLSASYSREVSGGGGFVGASVTTSTGALVRRQIFGNWFAEAGANYSINKSATTLLFSNVQQGNSILGFAAVEHAFSQSLGWNVRYDRLHESYNGIAAISSTPDTDRVTVSLQWKFMRPLGR
jgi:hypothetical protein